MLGPRRGWGVKDMKPHNVVYTMIGGSLLWVGWFGFNAGSALNATDGHAGFDMMVTQATPPPPAVGDRSENRDARACPDVRVSRATAARRLASPSRGGPSRRRSAARHPPPTRRAPLQIATATSGFVFMLVEWAHRGKPSVLGIVRPAAAPPSAAPEIARAPGPIPPRGGGHLPSH